MKLSSKQVDSIVEEISEQVSNKRIAIYNKKLEELKLKKLPIYITEFIEASRNYTKTLSDCRKILGGNFCKYASDGISQENILCNYYSNILEKSDMNLSYTEKNKIKRNLTIKTIDPELDISKYIEEVVKSY